MLCMTHGDCKYRWPYKDGGNGQTKQGCPRRFAWWVPDLPHPFLAQQPFRLDRDYHQRKGWTLPPPSTSLVLRVQSLPPPCVACRRRAMQSNCVFIMSFNLKRHNSTDKILKRHKYVFKNCITFTSQKFQYYLCVFIFLNNIIIVVIFTWQIQQRNNMYDVLIVDSSSPSRTSFVTSHLTTWFQTQFLVTRLSHFHFMSSTATHTFNLPSGYSFNTPNVTVTGGVWEASGLWWKRLLHHNIFIWLPRNCHRKVSASLFT